MESRRLVRVSMCARIDRNGCGDGGMRVFVCVYECVCVCVRVCECLSVSNENSMIYTKENESEREKN